MTEMPAHTAREINPGIGNTFEPISQVLVSRQLWMHWVPLSV